MKNSFEIRPADAPGMQDEKNLITKRRSQSAGKRRTLLASALCYQPPSKASDYISILLDESVQNPIALGHYEHFGYCKA